MIKPTSAPLAPDPSFWGSTRAGVGGGGRGRTGVVSPAVPCAVDVLSCVGDGVGWTSSGSEKGNMGLYIHRKVGQVTGVLCH